MAVDERSEVRFFDPWSDVAVATNFSANFVDESDLQCVDWTSSHYVRDIGHPVLGTLGWAKKTSSQHPPWRRLCGNGLIHAHPLATSLHHWNHDTLLVPKSRSSSKHYADGVSLQRDCAEKQPICAVLNLNGAELPPLPWATGWRRHSTPACWLVLNFDRSTVRHALKNT